MTVSPAVRSALTTALVILGLLIAGAQAPDANIPATWIAGLTLAATVLRTAVAWLDKGNTSFGRGSVPPEPPIGPAGGGDGGELDYADDLGDVPPADGEGA